jgi:hypothetical protein
MRELAAKNSRNTKSRKNLGFSALFAFLAANCACVLDFGGRSPNNVDAASRRIIYRKAARCRFYDRCLWIIRDNACPFCSHGIVAFNGWPLNALRRDNNYKKVNLPVGKNSAKKTAFSSGKRGIAVKGVFRFQENLGKHPYVSCGKIRPAPKNTEKASRDLGLGRRQVDELHRSIPRLGQDSAERHYFFRAR